MATLSARRPVLSVVMCVYNGARFLAQAINSIRAQTFRSFEFVIVDDGSTDDTPRILAEHAASDGRIRVLPQENQGLIAALNRGIACAQAELIARMDADDVAKPYRFEMQLDFLSGRPWIALLGGAVEIIDAGGRVLNTIRVPLDPDHVRREMLEYRCALAHPTVIFRRRAFERAGGFRKAYRHAEDYDLWLRMTERCQAANLDDVLLGYRWHPKGVSCAHAPQQILSALCARTTAKLRLRGMPDPTFGGAPITVDLLRQFGVEQRVIDAEIFAGLRVRTQEAIRYGAASAAADFVRSARRYASPGCVNEMTAALLLEVVRSPGGLREKVRYCARLLRADPGAFARACRALIRGGNANLHEQANA